MNLLKVKTINSKKRLLRLKIFPLVILLTLICITVYILLVRFSSQKEIVPNQKPKIGSILNATVSIINNEVWITDSQGNNIKRITSDNIVKSSPVLSPDNSKVAYLSSGQTGVSLVSISDQKVVNLTPEIKDVLFTDISWSPDNRYLSVYGSSENKILSTIIEIKTGKTILDLSCNYPILPKDYGLIGLYQGFISPIIWKPNSQRISYIKNGNLILADMTNHNPVTLATEVTTLVISDRWAETFKPKWSKNGGFVFYKKNTLSPECMGCQDDYIYELSTNRVVKISNFNNTVDPEFDEQKDFFQRLQAEISTPVINLNRHTNFDISKNEFQEIPSDIPTPIPTPKPYSNRELNQEEYEAYIKVFGIRSIEVPKEYGKPFLDVEWNSDFPLYYDKKQGAGYHADRGRMVILTYSNLKQPFGVNLTYSTYDFSAGTEYFTYGTKEDYELINKDEDQGYKIITVNNKKAYLKYEINSDFEQKLLRKVVEFPFENYYIAFVYWFDHLDNYEQEVDNLYAGIYPKDEIGLKQFDSLISSIKFN